MNSRARLAVGQPYCWGRDGGFRIGRLVPGYADGSAVPTLTSMAFSDAVSVDAGNSHACLLRSNDTLYCWGTNLFGQLGNGNKTHTMDPQPVTAGAETTFTKVSGGHNATCAITATEKVYCWGSNGSGLLGQPAATVESTSPLFLLDDAVDLSVGQNMACAIRRDSVTPTDPSLFFTTCWGDGVAASGVLVDIETPAGGTNLLGLHNLSVGRDAGCGILTEADMGTTTDSVYCWGSKTFPTGHTTALPSADLVTDLPTNISDVGALHISSCATTHSGELWCWGERQGGNFGLGLLSDKMEAEQIMGVTNAASIAEGTFEQNIYYITTGNELYSIGSNLYGQAGGGGLVIFDLPKEVVGLPL